MYETKRKKFVFPRPEGTKTGITPKENFDLEE